MTAIQDEIDKLATLGSTQAVALHLAGLGVSGTCGSANSCVLAVHLTRAAHADGWTDISVGPLGVSGYNVISDGDVVEGPRHDLPPMLTEFIGEFDSHEYPELVRF